MRQPRRAVSKACTAGATERGSGGKKSLQVMGHEAATVGLSKACTAGATKRSTGGKKSLQVMGHEAAEAGCEQSVRSRWNRGEHWRLPLQVVEHEVTEAGCEQSVHIGWNRGCNSGQLRWERRLRSQAVGRPSVPCTAEKKHPSS